MKSNFIKILPCIMVASMTTFQASEGKLSSYVSKENRPTLANEWSFKLKDKEYKLSGSFHDLSKKEIQTILSQAFYLSDFDLETYLMNTGMFSSVTVSSSNKVVEIKLVEYPLLGKFDLDVRGGAKPPKEQFKQITDALKLNPRTRLSPNLIRTASSNLRLLYMQQFATSNVDVKVYEKERDGFIDLTFCITVVPEKALKDVVFVGNKGLSSRLLRRAVVLTKKGLPPIPMLTYSAITETQIEETSKALVSLANSRGYLDFKINSITIEENDLKNKYLAVVLREGPEYKVADVKLTAYLDDLDPKLHDHIVAKANSALKRIVTGNAFRSDTFNEAKYLIEKSLVQNNLLEYEVVSGYTKIGEEPNLNLSYVIKKQDKIRKIRKIIFFNNDSTNDQTLARYLQFQAGDPLSDAALQISKSYLNSSDIVEKVEIDAVEIGESDRVDVKVTVTETKRLQGQVGVNTNTNSLVLAGGINFRAASFAGSGYALSGDIELGEMPSIKARLDMPFIFGPETNFYIEMSMGRRTLNRANLFGPGNMFEAILEGILGRKFEDLRSLVDKLARNQKQLNKDSNLDIRQTEYPISPYWNDRYRPVSDTELRTCFKSGVQFPVDEKHTITLGLGLTHRSFIHKPPKGKSESKYIPTEDPSTVVSGQDRKLGSESTEINRKSLPDGTKVFSAIGYNEEDARHYKVSQESGQIRICEISDGDGNIVLNHPDYPSSSTDDPRVKPGQKIDVCWLGLGRSPALKDSLDMNEKIEISPFFKHEYKDKIHQFEAPYTLWSNFTFTLGTTTSLKVQLGANISKRLNEYVLVGLGVTVGRSFNNHFLDNFTSEELGMCTACGPVELYDFTDLGGRWLAKVVGTVEFDVFESNICQINPYIRLAFGSIWDSGIKAQRLPKILCSRRNWEQNTIDIAQDDFNAIGILTPGVAFKFGPVKVDVGINLKFLDNCPDLNRNSGIGGLDISLGLDL